MTIHHDIPFAEYRSLPGWNWSLIKLLETGSPKHVQHALTSPDEDTASRVLLRAVHALVLEPHNFGASFSVYDGRRDARTAAYQQHLAEHPGTAVLSAKDHEAAQVAAAAILAHPFVREALSEGHPEVTLTWDDEETGLPCKARLDWLASGLFLDLKTLGTTHERHVARLVATNLYHGQLAHYAAGLRAHGIDVPAYLVVAEGKGAQDVAVVSMSAASPGGAVHVGGLLRSKLMRKLADCVALDHWPGRHPEPHELCLPMWALPDIDDEITDEDDTSEEAA